MVDGQSPAWFDLNEFAPGFRRESAGVYLLDEVGSTNDFLLGRGDPASGILLRRESGSWLRAAKGELAPPPGTTCFAPPRESRPPAAADAAGVGSAAGCNSPGVCRRRRRKRLRGFRSGPG